jgi:hypothetical protein
MAARLPNNHDRTVVIGRTGTGKTVAALWHLSNYPIEREPWIAIDFKRDQHLNSIANAQEIDFDYIPGPKEDGLFIIHAIPSDAYGTNKDRSKLDQYFVKLWERENIGIFIDEGYAAGNSEGLELCLTQGRSKCIPMIICSQRPSWISRFVFSEASYIQYFPLNDARDRDTVEEFMPIEFDEEAPLEKHHSFYYDVSENEIYRFAPVPNMTAIRGVFGSKLRRKMVRI